MTEIVEEEAKVVKQRRLVGYRCDLCGTEWREPEPHWVVWLRDRRDRSQQGGYDVDLCASCGQQVRKALPTLGLDSPHERRCDQGGGPSEPQERIPKAGTNARCLVLHRGNNRENLFVQPRNYRHFLQLYARYVEPVADAYVYCLLRNHFHLLDGVKAGDERQQTFEVSKQTSILAYPWWRVASGG